MYGFNEMNTSDITRAVKFIKKNNIKHVSWYALEVKDNSAIAKQKYQINDDHVEKQLRIIIKCMRSIYFQRYEVSS
jgi:oxygen-independent coproporphyrinogen-3 oxidase